MSFFYTVFGDGMKVYLDVLFLLNLGFDFLLLLSVSLLLRRRVTLKRIFLGSLVGSLSIFFLFFSISSVSLFLFKIIISIFMILVTFGYQNRTYFFQNFFFLYLVSIVLGGIFYFLNVNFSYKQEGLIFYHNGLSINFFLLFLLGPLSFFYYLKEMKSFKNNYSNTYEVTLFYQGKEYQFHAFLDTGNQLKDPITRKPIFLIYHKTLLENIRAPIYVPYETANGSSILPCVKGEKMIIQGVGIQTHFLIGFLPTKLSISGIDALLSNELMEGNHV